MTTNGYDVIHYDSSMTWWRQWLISFFQILHQVAEDITFKLREILDLARRAARRSRRDKITGNDFDQVIQEKGDQPLLGANYKNKKKIFNQNEIIYFHEKSICYLKYVVYKSP